MKKIVVVMLVLSLFASSSFAATLLATDKETGYTVQATAPVNNIIGKTSKGVRVAATYETTAYALVTMHLNGSKYYGTAYDASKLMVKSPAGDISAAFAAPAFSVADTAFTSTDGWTAL